MKKIFMSGVSMVCAFMILAGAGIASANASTADLEVEMRGANRQFVYSPYVYRARVTNVGGTRAENVKVTIDLPLSANSPTQYPLGRLSSIDNKCALVNNKLECDLGRIKPGKRKNAKFTFVMPVTTRTLEFTATATADVDVNPNNNADTKVLRPKYQQNIINGPVDVINQHCTGGPTLTSFYECVLAPTSVTDHPTTLNADNTISFQVPGYTGTWSQPTNKELHFSYQAGSTTVLEFRGYAVSSTCFEGLSTFPTNNLYVSPYKVCFQ